MVSLRLFGGPSLTDENGPIVGPAAQRHRLALLALLATARPGGLKRDKLWALLWPERDREHARQLLNQSIHSLRKVLGEATILSAGDNLRFNPLAIDCDVVSFEEGLASGAPARAVALYAGPFLDGFFLSDAAEFERWVDGERERLSGLYGKALEALAVEAESERDFARASELWKKRAVHDPFDSRIAQRLMLALEAGGNRGGALQHAAIHERLLRHEFDIDAAPEVAVLAERLRTEPSWAAPGTSAPDPSPYAAGSPPRTLGDSAPADPPAAGSPGPQRTMARHRWRVSAAALLVGVSVAGSLYAAWPRDPGSARSIVVLPFVDLSPGGDTEYFSDGLTEEIITRLSAIPELKVISRTSAMHYKGTTRPLREIADELGVDRVLEGSVRQSDGRVRITAQLVDARGDAHLWAQNYDYELRDVFRVQEEIARAVADALALEVGERERAALARRGTSDPDAYHLYRRARFLWGLRTREGHEQAIEYYRRAIDLDPMYAEAYAGIADTHLTAYQFDLFDQSESEAYSHVKGAAERALAIDDRSADAHASFAITLWWQRNWPGAERELRRAIELNPGHATARSWYSLLLGGMGRWEESLAESRRSYELDPLAPAIANILAWQHLHRRDYDLAIEQYRNTMEVFPTYDRAYSGLSLALSKKGSHAEAIQAAREAVRLNPANLPWLAYVTAVAGARSEATALLERAKRNPPEPFAIARAYAGLAEPDSAFAWLDRSLLQWPHRGALADPTLDPLRADPRFARLTARVEQEMGIR